MTWIPVSTALPSGEALIFADGAYYLGILVGDEADRAFMDIHTADLLPWPSYWMNLPPPPVV